MSAVVGTQVLATLIAVLRVVHAGDWLGLGGRGLGVSTV